MHQHNNNFCLKQQFVWLFVPSQHWLSRGSYIRVIYIREFQMRCIGYPARFILSPLHRIYCIEELRADKTIIVARRI